MQTQSPEQKMKLIIDEYKRLFASEYFQFCQQVIETRRMQSNEFGEIKGTDTEIRALSEVPDTLDVLFLKNLDVNGWKFYKSREGQRWLVKNFNEFKIPEKI